MSSSSHPAPSTFHLPPLQLLKDLSLASDPTTASTETWHDLTESSLTWLLSLSAKRGGKGKEKELVHWYCGSNGAENCWESAVFLIRLLAFKRNGEVGEWRDLFDELMLTCPLCVHKYQRAKLEFRERYLKLLKTAPVITQFFASLSHAESTSIHASLSSLAPNSNLSQIPLPVLEHILVNPYIFQQPSIVEMISSLLPLNGVLGLPPIVSPGLLAFALNENMLIRDWAVNQLAVCEGASDEGYKEDGLKEVMEAHLHVLTSRDRDEKDEEVSLVMYPETRRPFWKGLVGCLKALSVEAIKRNLTGGGGVGRKFDIVSLVVGHLGDRGDHLEFVVEGFENLLRALGAEFWKSDDEKFEEVVLHSILDNEEFEERGVKKNDSRFLNWIRVFILSVRHSPDLFVGSLAIISSTFLERFQAERFEVAARIGVLRLVLEVFEEVFFDNPGNSGGVITLDGGDSFNRSIIVFPYAKEAERVLELHSGFIAEIAFGGKYCRPPWVGGNDVAIRFVGNVMARDSKRLVENVFELARYRESVIVAEMEKLRAKKKGGVGGGGVLAKEPPLLSICRSLWGQAYSRLREDDTRGLAVVLKAVSASSHIERLGKSGWYLPPKEDGTPPEPGEIDVGFCRPWMKVINEGIDVIRTPLIPIVRGLAEDHSELLLNFLSLPSVGECISILLLSPIEEVYSISLNLVKQAFDVTDRRESIRSFLFQLPDQTLRGLAYAIKQFVTSAKILPETTGMAKRLVRCLTDVIEALCAPRDGLLREASFLERSDDNGIRKRLLNLWKLMCQALGLLFKQTPTWANYFEPEQMTEWMRDAILFGGDMLDNVWTFDLIISGQGLLNSTSSPTKLSNNGHAMVIALSDPLEELIAWLRLTDIDLLTSSFELVVKMLNRFARSGITVRESISIKVKRSTEKALMKTDATTDRSSSRLSHAQLRELAALVNDGGASVSSPPIPRKKSSSSTSSKKGPIEVIQIDDDDDEKPPPKKVSTTLPKPFPKPASSTSSKPSSSQLSTALSRLPSRPVPSLIAYRPAPPTASTSRLSKPPPVIAARPRGMPWTTYSSKPTESSSEEESSSDDEKSSGLLGLAKVQKSPKIKQAERRTVKLYDQSTGRNGRSELMDGKSIQEQQRVANAARLRGAQDFSNLHRQILQWDITHDGTLPPNLLENPRGVASTFDSPEEYFQAFEPLLLVEFWEQVRQAKLDAPKDRSGAPIAVDVAGRQAVDDFTDVFITIEHSKIPDGVWFSESDLLILRQNAHQTLAKVQASARKKDVYEITLRCHLGKDHTNLGAVLMPKTKWQIVKLLNISTMHREYSALTSLRYLNLSNEILKPQAPRRIVPSASKIERTMKVYQVNEPQARAIIGSLSSNGFSLIQGPPGTGKTKTILGLIGAFIDGRAPVATPIFAGKATSRPLPVSKVLLCAPSNAAVDEVAKRLKMGIRLSNGELVVPKVVRIGSESAVDASVRDIFLDDLVETALGKINGDGVKGGAPVDVMALRAEVNGLRGERDSKREELDKMDNNNDRKAELVAEFKKIKSRIQELSNRLDTERDKAQQSKRALDAEQRKKRLEILSDADVICATLSGSGHDYMSQLPFDFETVIIDEAAQSIELGSLIPLKYGCQRCILVGDPLQLPPTVISKVAAQSGYDRSLFVRMMQHDPSSVHLLSIQYRMHSQISAFPSTAFYDSRLTDGPGMDEKTKQPWHKSPLFPPYAFMHVRNGTEVQGNHHSWTNPVEANTALAIYERLRLDFPGVNLDYRIGIVTPYKGQVGELKRQFRNKYGESILMKISFNTVDGFQGQEKDIIILSCVRGGADDKGVGFLADTRRMNVALTRARSSLFVLGDQRKLQTNAHWRKLVFDAKARGFLTEVDASTFRSSKNSTAPLVHATATASTKHAMEIAISVPLYTPHQITEAAQAKASPSRLPSNPTTSSSKPAPSSSKLRTGPLAPLKRKASLPANPDTSKKPKAGLPNKPPPVSSAATMIAPPSAPAHPMLPKKPPPSLFLPKKRPPNRPAGPGPPRKK